MIDHWPPRNKSSNIEGVVVVGAIWILGLDSDKEIKKMKSLLVNHVYILHVDGVVER